MNLSTSEGRAAEVRRLLEFGAASAAGSRLGFGYLGDDGRVVPAEGLQLWITTRMTHTYGLAALLGHPLAGGFVEHGVDALLGAFHDDAHGGWFGRLTSAGEPLEGGKEMYGHAFVVLAGATATAVGADGADRLLERALEVVDRHFWDDERGACRETWDRAWTAGEAYGGANSNMHAFEAFLAAGAVTGDRTWLDRAARIAARFVHDAARAHRWRMPEHFSADWDVLLHYNQARPAHRFRPYGVTIGHLLEWSRLLVHLDAAMDPAPPWLLAAAIDLFDTAVAIGWEADGQPGFIYTVDWSDRPVVAARMHWVAVEGVMAAEALARSAGAPRFGEWRDRLWTESTRFVDTEAGGWWHELDPSGAVGRTVWSGKPDLYHAVQALIFPDMPLTPSMVTSVRTSAGRPA